MKPSTLSARSCPRGRNRDWSLFPVFLWDIDPAQCLGPILSPFEPPMKLADISRGVLLILLVREAGHPGTGLFSQTQECRIHFLGRDPVSDQEELSLRIFLGEFR